jgi:alkanesulfonate monooxygenase SsuD/methylene tetrahydromethanopterin reductase-like flavin-dependent oxidoreductase (luciferase family)
LVAGPFAQHWAPIRHRVQRGSTAHTIGQVLTDLVLSPFGADPGEMVAASVAAEAGFAGVYTYDHFSGVVAGRPWSRDPFVVLGAIAVRTQRLRLGVLVANVVNRHAAQLASAVNTLQALAPGRVICGIGSGAAPGSRFAAEHDLIGRRLGDLPARRAALVDAIGVLRATWAGSAGGVPGVVDGAAPPPVVVGATAAETVAVAAQHADGVNIRRLPADALRARIELARSLAGERPFEVSVFDDLDLGHPLGGDPQPLAALGVDRRTLVVAPPFDLAVLGRIAAHLAQG